MLYLSLHGYISKTKHSEEDELRMVKRNFFWLMRYRYMRHSGRQHDDGK